MSESSINRPIRVGAALALSGRFAVQGGQAARGLRLWSEQLNAYGGLPVGLGRARRPVELLILDDQSRASTIEFQVERLLTQDRVDLLIGPYASNLALAAAEVAERHSVVLWNHGGSSDAIAARGFQWLVNLASPASQYYVGLLEAVRSADPAARRLALARGTGGTFPTAVANGVARAAQVLGFDLIEQAAYPSNSDDFSRLVDRLIAGRPDIVLGVGTTQADLAFARAWLSRRGEVGLLGLVAAPIDHFRSQLGEAVEEIAGPSQWEPSLRYQPDLGPTPAQFARRFLTRFDFAADYPAVQAYAAGLLAQRCVEISGTLESAALRATAANLSLTTCYGHFRIDARGEQIAHRLAIIQWRGGQKRVVWPLDLREQPLLVRKRHS